MGIWRGGREERGSRYARPFLPSLLTSYIISSHPGRTVVSQTDGWQRCFVAKTGKQLDNRRADLSYTDESVPVQQPNQCISIELR